MKLLMAARFIRPGDRIGDRVVRAVCRGPRAAWLPATQVAVSWAGTGAITLMDLAARQEVDRQPISQQRALALLALWKWNACCAGQRPSIPPPSDLEQTTIAALMDGYADGSSSWNSIVTMIAQGWTDELVAGHWAELRRRRPVWPPRMVGP